MNKITDRDKQIINVVMDLVRHCKVYPYTANKDVWEMVEKQLDN